MTVSVAIDGPAGSGKSTIAKIIANKLNYFYVDSGAFYRSVTYFFMREEVDFEDMDQVEKALEKIDFDVVVKQDNFIILLNGEDLSSFIRSREVTFNVSPVSAIAQVRDKVNRVFRELSNRHNIIMEGRDIGTVVLPQANFKFFLSASVEERAKRRLKELLEKGEDHTIENIKKDIERRDKLDSTREVAPLKKAQNAVEVDTTKLSIDEVVNTIVDYMKNI